MVTRSWLTGLAAVAIQAGSAAGQSRGLELNLHGGYYVPTNDEGIERAIRDAKRRGSLLYGGRLTYWTGRTLGVEASAGYSEAKVLVTTGAGTFPRGTDLWYGTGKLMLNLTPGSKGLGIAVGGGVAYLRSGKLVTDPTKSGSEVGGVGGLSVRLQVGDNVALRGDIEDLFYGGDFGKGNKFTQDLLLSVGLAIKL
jgi:hypothetical protein